MSNAEETKPVADGTAPKEVDLWQRGGAHGLDPSSRDELITRYLPLVKVAAGRLAMMLPLRFDPEDCYGAGALALIRTVDGFDRSRGVPFEAYAYPRIYGSMVDHVRAQDWIPRSVRAAVQKLRHAYRALAAEDKVAPDDEVVAAHLSISIEEFKALVQRASPAIVLSLDSVDEPARYHPPRDVIPEADESPSARLERQELVHLVADAIAKLGEAERAVVVLHYHEGLMFKEVAQILALSRARISQLHAKALLKLRAIVSQALEPRPRALVGGGEQDG